MEIITAASGFWGGRLCIIIGMKAKLQRYLQKTFGSRLPYAMNDINHSYSIGGKFHIRFELGGGLSNGTKARVEHATQRAVMLFEETFQNREEEIWILIYDYLGESLFGKTTGFLKQQFSVAVYAGFYKKLEMVRTGDEGQHKTRIIIGKIRVKYLEYENILNAIANTEMGFEPKLSETVFFIGTKTSKIFHMYDDRGCFVECNTVDGIRDLYLKRNTWIVDYHRSEIAEQF